MATKKEARPSVKRRAHVSSKHNLILTQFAKEGIFVFSMAALCFGGIYAAAFVYALMR